MKKLVVILMSILIIVSGCGSQTDNQNKVEENKKETLKVGMELKWPPFEMTGTSGKAEGISVLIAKELGNYLGREVEVVDLPFTSLIPALETEKIDIIIASMSINEEREQKIAFSKPYMYFKLLTAVNKNSGIHSLEELFTKEKVRFVAPKSFVGLKLALEKANNPELLEFDDKSTASLELANGNADAFIIDAVGAADIAKTYPDLIEVIYEPVEVSKIAAGMRKTDTDLLEKVNQFVSKMDELGVNQKIKDQYDEILKEKVGKGYEFYLNEN